MTLKIKSMQDKIDNDNQKMDPTFLKNLTTSDRFALGRHSINTFSNNWNKLLRDISDG